LKFPLKERSVGDSSSNQVLFFGKSDGGDGVAMAGESEPCLERMCYLAQAIKRCHVRSFFPSQYIVYMKCSYISQSKSSTNRCA
uniref:Ovule protein n=1 Tax=Haemonchus placei TaxID=6290 RepID=A0A0N4X5C5_HAEPC